MSHKGHRLNRIELQSPQEGFHKVQTTFIDERKCSILYGTANYQCLAAGFVLYANQSPATEESYGNVRSPYVISMEKTRLIEAGLLCTHVGDPPAVLVTQVEYLHTTTA